MHSAELGPCSTIGQCLSAYIVHKFASTTISINSIHNYYQNVLLLCAEFPAQCYYLEIHIFTQLFVSCRFRVDVDGLWFPIQVQLDISAVLRECAMACD